MHDDFFFSFLCESVKELPFCLFFFYSPFLGLRSSCRKFGSFLGFHLNSVKMWFFIARTNTIKQRSLLG